MKYGSATKQVVLGVVIAYLGYFLATESTVFAEWVVASIVSVVGLYLAIHGLFTGIEASVAAGTERPSTEDSTE